MTQLFIDDMEVVLPEGFSCKTVSENPFFTKAGDYTLNITLSLENPINLNVYKHINRINSLSRFENRTAMLISNNEVVIRGKEVILKYSNKDIEIQIVAGNSSLNYLIGNDLKIRDLNLGKAVINKSTIKSDLNNRYPNKDWLLLPFYDPDKKFIGNRYTYKKNNNYYSLEYAYDGQYLSTFQFYQDNYYDFDSWLIKYENYRPQPFFCFIIEEVFKALGYTVENAISKHDIYKNAYIVHGQDTLEFAKMLPNWTVEKFFSEIENLFDCTTVVDNETMHANIIFNHNYYKNGKEVDAIMLDEFEAEIEDDFDLMSYEKNIAYNLPDSTYYKYQNIPEQLREKAKYWWGMGTPEKRIKDMGTQIANIDIRYRKNVGNQIWYAAPFNFIDIVRDGKVTPFAIDDYRPLINDDKSETIHYKSDIIPAEFVVMPYYIRDRIDITKNSYIMYQMPIARCIEEPVYDIQSGDKYVFPRIEDYIEGNNEIENNTEPIQYDRLSLALYYATWSSSNEGSILNQAYDGLPLMFTRGITENYISTIKDFGYILEYDGGYDNLFSLQFLNRELYKKNSRINKKKIYKVRFLNTVRKLDPKHIYIIGNRKFYCIKLTRNITINGFDEVVDGEFYSED